VAGTTLRLAGDCTTDVTISVPDGFTLDGGGATITAVDPSGGRFQGAVIQNQGSVANVVNLRITVSGLAVGCDPLDQRLRGIFFDGASGLIYRNTVTNVNRSAAPCLEGNAIEIQNAASNPAQVVEVYSNRVSAYQQTGIVCDGNVTCIVRSNYIGQSAAQDVQPVNSLQVGFGAAAVVENNDIAGNSWTGSTNIASTAVLLVGAATGTVLRHNNIMEGNADVGIYIQSNGVIVDNNRVYESGPDLNAFGADYGIANVAPNPASATVVNNKVRGFLIPYYLPDLASKSGGNNKVVSSPYWGK
jgi:hypothetical protein